MAKCNLCFRHCNISEGSYGCKLRCPFCQNYHISWGDEVASFKRKATYVSPAELVRVAEEQTANGNIGVAFTYNEPLISYEYVLDTAKLLKEKDLKTVLVSNGMADVETVRELFDHIDAMNIDLKGFTDHYYEDILLGNRKMVMEFIKEATPVDTIYHLKSIAEKHLTYVYTGNC